jgi:hypothetical protein
MKKLTAMEEAHRRSGMLWKKLSEMLRKKLSEEANCHGRSSMTKRNAMEEAQRNSTEGAQ